MTVYEIFMIVLRVIDTFISFGSLLVAALAFRHKKKSE